MICNKCGTNVPHGAAYCPECGKPLEKPKKKGGKLPLHTVLPWQEKPWMGLLGALLGIVISMVAAVLILFWDVSFMAIGFTGFLVGLLVPSLWWQLAGRIGKVSKWVCVALIILGAWLDNWVTWMFEYLFRYHAAGETLADALLGAWKILFNNAYTTDYYAMELFFLFTGAYLGGFIIFTLHKGACEE